MGEFVPRKTRSGYNFQFEMMGLSFSEATYASRWSLLSCSFPRQRFFPSLLNKTIYMCNTSQPAQSRARFLCLCICLNFPQVMSGRLMISDLEVQVYRDTKPFQKGIRGVRAWQRTVNMFGEAYQLCKHRKEWRAST